jgi:hypothetical protein
MICLNIFFENATMTYIAKIPRPMGRTVVSTLVQLVTMEPKEVPIAVTIAVEVVESIFNNSFQEDFYVMGGSQELQ